MLCSGLLKRFIIYSPLSSSKATLDETQAVCRLLREPEGGKGHGVHLEMGDFQF